MLIAISATGNTLDATVDPRFGRAQWLLIVETDTSQLVEAIDNTAGKEAAHGAGISVAAMVADKGVSAILTGRVGPKAMPILDKAGVRAVNDISGPVREAITTFTSSSAQSSPQADNRQQAPQGQEQGRGQGCGQGKGIGRGMGQGKGQGRGGCRR